MNRKILCLTLLAAFLLAPLALVAEDSKRKGKGDRGEQMREQAQLRIDACEGIAEGDACTFIGRNDEEAQGTCTVVRNKAVLCLAEGEERGGRRGGMGMGSRGGNRGGDKAEDVQS